jgi:UDP-glucose 4-epimerase
MRVTVTGAAGYIGAKLAERLSRCDWVEDVLALDIRPLANVLPKISFYQRDVTAPLDDLFQAHRPQAVVHLAFRLRPSHDRESVRRVNVGGTANVLRACAAVGVKHILYMGSTTVYGAHPDNPVPLTEEAPLRPVKGFQYAEDKVTAEGLLREHAAAHPGVCLTVLRGCVVMGPTAENFITAALGKPALVGVAGHDPPMQFLHEEDQMSVLLHLLERPRAGVYNIAGEGAVRYSEMVQLSRRRLFWLPPWVIYPLTEATWRLRLQKDSPACGLDMVRWPWVASTEKLTRETGFRFRHSSREALEAYVRRTRLG